MLVANAVIGHAMTRTKAIAIKSYTIVLEPTDQYPARGWAPKLRIEVAKHV